MRNQDQKTLYSLANFIDNSGLALDEKDALRGYFSRMSKALQQQAYLILVSNPEFLEVLSRFVSEEKEAIQSGDERKLEQVFLREFVEIGKHA